eukprot:CAMPEP_0171418598 /NCGR_PEP_ID=MMETSP0880-20121228/41190_1 /TAXON_ID=67004 /ORGANISM="Thalassiosira weissflogii, Strain CCMP1336" /LENGTH=227 /DNA_ID=CAMNT_0011936871 /DNA_START=169 /DNA_END=849 /DNA_ORIENTATION=-
MDESSILPRPRDDYFKGHCTCPTNRRLQTFSRKIHKTNSQQKRRSQLPTTTTTTTTVFSLLDLPLETTKPTPNNNNNNNNESNNHCDIVFSNGKSNKENTNNTNNDNNNDSKLNSTIQHTNQAERTLGILILLTVPLSWGTYTPVVKYMYDVMDPSMPGFVFSAGYYLVAAFSLGVLSGSGSGDNSRRHHRREGSVIFDADGENEEDLEAMTWKEDVDVNENNVVRR